MSAAVIDKADPRVAALVAEYETKPVDRTGAADRWLDSLTDDEFFAVNARWFGGAA